MLFQSKKNPALCLTLAALFAGGCARGDASENNVPNANPPSAKAAVQTSDESVRSLDFALSFYRRALEDVPEKENFLFSPFSARRTLSALSSGSDGRTKTEIDAALGKTNEEAWNAQTTKIVQTLDASDATAAVGSVWIQQGVVAKPEFTDRLRNVFQYETNPINFEGDGAKDKLDSWIRAQTDGRISEIAKNLSPQTRLLLVDAIVFQGNWKNAFPPSATRKGYVTDVKGTEIRVPVMQTKAFFPYHKADDCQYFEALCQDERFSFAVVLPTRWEDFPKIEKELTAERLREFRNAAKETELDVRLPKFSVERSFETGQTFQKLGVVEAFTNEADFRRAFNADSLRLDSVSQSVRLSLDEKGVEAVAATETQFVPKTAKKTEQFYADRPFLYFVRENTTGEILFFGRFVDPATATDDADTTDKTETNADTNTETHTNSDAQESASDAESDSTLTGPGGVLL